MLLFVFVTNFVPIKLEPVKAGLCRVYAFVGTSLLNKFKPADKLGVGITQCRFGRNPGLACKIGHGKQQVAYFLMGSPRIATGDFRLNLTKFFAALGQYALQIRPVKAHLCGPFGELFGPEQGGQGVWHIVKQGRDFILPPQCRTTLSLDRKSVV